jgi:hypothetical protein
MLVRNYDRRFLEVTKFFKPFTADREEVSGKGEEAVD